MNLFYTLRCNNTLRAPVFVPGSKKKKKKKSRKIEGHLVLKSYTEIIRQIRPFLCVSVTPHLAIQGLILISCQGCVKDTSRGEKKNPKLFPKPSRSLSSK